LLGPFAHALVASTIPWLALLLAHILLVDRAWQLGSAWSSWHS